MRPDEQEPLLTAAERVERGLRRSVTAGQMFTEEQQHWLDRIREHLVTNLSIEPDDFDDVADLRPRRWLGAGQSSLRRLPRRSARQLNEAIAA